MAEKAGAIGVVDSERNLNNNISRRGFSGGFFIAMSRSCWMSLFAIGGWLISLNPASAQSPEVKGVTSETSPIESKAPYAPNQEATPSNSFSIPVQIIGNQGDAEHTKAREAKSDEHDAKDLDAQIRAANAAERQVWLAYINIIFAAVGTIVILYSLKLTQKAVKEAGKSNEIAKTALIAETRPVIALETIYVGKDTAGRDEYAFRFKNIGRGPALLEQISIRRHLVPLADSQIHEMDETEIFEGMKGLVVPSDKAIMHPTRMLMSGNLKRFRFKSECTIQYTMALLMADSAFKSFKTISTAEFHPVIGTINSYGGELLIGGDGTPVSGDFSNCEIVGAIAKNIIAAKEMT